MTDEEFDEAYARIQSAEVNKAGGDGTFYLLYPPEAELETDTDAVKQSKARAASDWARRVEITNEPDFEAEFRRRNDGNQNPGAVFVFLTYA